MKEIVILSGKGGTGKTSITGGLAFIAEEKLVFADSDVDASNLHLILQKKVIDEIIFKEGFTAVINSEKCNGCEICYKECVFDSIIFKNKKAKVNEMFCEGCGLCYRLCPQKAISLNEQTVGSILTYETRFNSILIGAKMTTKRERSGKLVSEVKNAARRMAEKFQSDYLLVDGPPGIGCPVISTITGVDHVVIVTEPSISGTHDLIRAVEITSKFNLKTWVIINKYDLNYDMANKIELYCNNLNITIAGKFLFNPQVVDAMVNCKSIIEFAPESKFLNDIIEAYKMIING